MSVTILGLKGKWDWHCFCYCQIGGNCEHTESGRLGIKTRLKCALFLAFDAEHSNTKFFHKEMVLKSSSLCCLKHGVQA